MGRRFVCYTLHDHRYDTISSWEFAADKDEGVKVALEAMLDCTCDYDSQLTVAEAMFMEEQVSITREVVTREESEVVCIGDPETVTRELGIRMEEPEGGDTNTEEADDWDFEDEQFDPFIGDQDPIGDDTPDVIDGAPYGGRI